MEKSSLIAYEFEGCQFNLRRHCLLNDQGETKDLSPRAFKVLRYLCERPEKVVTGEELIREVWGISVGLGSANEAIKEIRKAIGEKKGKEIIKTVYKYGWKLDCKVVERADDPDGEEGVVVEDTSDEVSLAQKSVEAQASGEDLLAGPRTDPPNVSTAVPAESGPAAVAGSGGEVQTAPGETQDEQAPQEGRGDATPEGDDSDGIPNDRYETFERWVGGGGVKLVLMLSGCIVVAVLLSVKIFDNYGAAAAKQVASGFQFLVISGMYLHSKFWMKAKRLPSIKERNEAAIIKAGFKNAAEYEKERPGLETDLKNHATWWCRLLASWVPLYLVFAFGDFPYHELLLVLFNLGNTFMLGACFYSLNKYTDEEDREHIAGWVLNILLLLAWMIVLAALLLKENYVGALLLTGITAGITMALYVGRLQSRFLGPRFLIIYFLYSYTAIQPLFLYVQNNPGWRVIILNFALFLKCLLYIYMAWLFQSGLLLFYFASVKRTAMHQQRRAFRELLHNRPSK